jgi:hypothetical protein
MPSIRGFGSATGWPARATMLSALWFHWAGKHAALRCSVPLCRHGDDLCIDSSPSFCPRQWMLADPGISSRSSSGANVGTRGPDLARGGLPGQCQSPGPACSKPHGARVAVSAAGKPPQAVFWDRKCTRRRATRKFSCSARDHLDPPAALPGPAGTIRLPSGSVAGWHDPGGGRPGRGDEGRFARPIRLSLITPGMVVPGVMQVGEPGREPALTVPVTQGMRPSRQPER